MKEVFEISPEWLIKSAAYRGKWIDQSQSLNVYFSGASGKELAAIYDYGWEMGLKTTYYLRTLGASQVEKSTVNASEFGSTHKRGAEKSNEENSTSAIQAEDKKEEMTASQKMALAAFENKDTKSAPKLCMILDPECEACQ